MPKMIERGALRLAVTEFTAVTLWVSVSLLLFALSTSSLLHRLSPVLRTFPPFQVFLVGLVLVMAIWEFFGLSLGSPFNPSVTLSLAIARRITAQDAATMFFAQFSGHAFGVLLVRSLSSFAFSDTIENVFSPPQPHEKLSHGSAMIIEAIITASLCAVVLVIDDILPKSATFKKFSIISTIIVVILSVFGEWTGSCMNPAMSFALSLHERRWSAHSVYWVGPICGAVFAGVWYDFRASKEGAVRRARNKKLRRTSSSGEVEHVLNTFTTVSKRKKSTH